MSTDWNIYCRTCDEEHSFDDANHMEDDMAALIDCARSIADLAPLLANDRVGHKIEFTLGRHGSIDAAWFAAHLGHELVPRDEYGRCSDQCGKRVRCAGCRVSHLCTFKPGHEPPCGGSHDVAPEGGRT